MRQFAGFAEEAEGAIEKEDYSTFANLMEKVLCENIQYKDVEGWIPNLA